jgi:hypothetical protein
LKPSTLAIPKIVLFTGELMILNSPERTL